MLNPSKLEFDEQPINRTTKRLATLVFLYHSVAMLKSEPNTGTFCGNFSLNIYSINLFIQDIKRILYKYINISYKGFEGKILFIFSPLATLHCPVPSVHQTDSVSG